MLLKKTLLLLSFIYCCTVISQKSTIKDHAFFFKKMDSLNTIPNNLLKVTSLFFNNQQWDSVIVYSSKALLNKMQKPHLYYFNYMRGSSFMRKNLFREAQKELEKIPNHFLFYNKVLYALSGVFLEQNKFKKALLYLKKIKEKELSAFDEINQLSITNDIGVCYLHLKDYKNAQLYLSEFLNSIKKKNNTTETSEAYTNIANLYYEQYKDSIAISYFTKAYKLAQKTSNNELKRLTTKNMAVVEENRKDLLKAITYRKESEKWRELVYNQEKIYEVSKLEKKILEQQKQNEINALKLENKAKSFQRNGFITSSLLLFLLLSVGAYFLIQKNKSHKIINTQKTELDLLNKTKDKLFSIVSHDLRSSVNLMQKSNTKLIKNIEKKNYSSLNTIANKNASIASSTYNLLENLLNWANIQTKQLYFHIESIDLYSVVQQIEYNYIPLFENKELNFTNNVKQPSFILADLDSLKIIIRNLLDNAIKFTPLEGKINCKTSIDIKNNATLFIIEDTGIGMDEKMIKELLLESPLLSRKKNQQEIGTGLGIQLCKNLAVKNNASFNIESNINQGTKIILKFPNV